MYLGIFLVGTSPFDNAAKGTENKMLCYSATRKTMNTRNMLGMLFLSSHTSEIHPQSAGCSLLFVQQEL